MGHVNSSYLLGFDSVSGWGERYFYTFYSEYGERKALAATEVAILAVTFLFSLILNTTIACAVLRYREMRTVTNCFLLNLAAADLVFAFGIPFVALTRISQDWILGDMACRLLPYSQFVCGFVLLWTLTLISMDRHRCIVVPPYRSQLTPRLAALLTFGTWLLASILFLPVAFWFRKQTAQGRTFCTMVFPQSDTVNLSICFTVPVILLACMLPMSLLVFHYQRIFQKLLKTRNRWSNNSQLAVQLAAGVIPRRESTLSVIGSMVVPWSRKISTSSQSGNGLAAKTRIGPAHEEARLQKHIRVVRVLLLNVIAVLLMWLPITVLMFLIYIDGSRPTEDTNFFLRSYHFIWALLIALLNTVVNPLLYGVLSENFRSCFAKLWFGSYRRRRKNRFLVEPGQGSRSPNPRERSQENGSSPGEGTPSGGRWNEAFSASPPRPSPNPSQTRNPN